MQLLNAEMIAELGRTGRPVAPARFRFDPLPLNAFLKALLSRRHDRR
jgi:hypothetical protein